MHKIDPVIITFERLSKTIFVNLKNIEYGDLNNIDIFANFVIIQSGFRVICGKITYKRNMHKIDPVIITFERLMKFLVHHHEWIVEIKICTTNLRAMCSTPQIRIARKNQNNYLLRGKSLWRVTSKPKLSKVYR